LKSYLRALSFLTVIPLPHVQFSSDSRELSASAACFPLAGATLGIFFAGSGWLAGQVFPPAPVAVIVLIISFLLTRGLHFDGLTDAADGLIGTTSREKAFKAMEDSSIGVMGAASLFFVYLLKFTLLAELGAFFLLPIALFFMPLAGRWAIVYAGAWFAPARNQGLGGLFLRELRWPVLLKASTGALFLIALVSWRQPDLLGPVLGGCVLALAAAHILAFYASRRLGGLTGDILGACSELGEMFFLTGFYLASQLSGAAALTTKVVISLVQGF